MAGSQDLSPQDSLSHQKGILGVVWSAALEQEVGVEGVEGVEGQPVMPAKTQSCPGEKQELQALPQ